MAFGIARGHANAAVGDAAGAIDFDVILFAHLTSALVAHHLGITALVATRGETVINP